MDVFHYFPDILHIKRSFNQTRKYFCEFNNDEKNEFAAYHVSRSHTHAAKYENITMKLLYLDYKQSTVVDNFRNIKNDRGEKAAGSPSHHAFY